MTTPMTIHSTPSSVQLTTSLDADQQLSLTYGDVPLSRHGNAIEIFLDSPTPVTVELLDFKNSGHWTLTATPGGNASGGLNSWERGDGLCRTRWKETASQVRVDVTATNGNASKTKPLFIKVRPPGARPEP